MEQNYNYAPREIIKVKEGIPEKMEDKVAREEPVTIFLNDKELVTMMATPVDLEYLALGFLCSEGFLESKDDVLKLHADIEKGLIYVNSKEEKAAWAEQLYGRRTITTGCGKGSTFFSAWDSLRSRPANDEFRVDASWILFLVKSMQEKAQIFRETGGVHSAALGDEKGIQIFTEDVGRHNALDKIVGQCFWKDISLTDKVLISSGRISSEMMLKAAKLQVPVVVSRAAPTTLGVDLAEKMSITMVGFARNKRLNIYSCPERIVMDNSSKGGSCADYEP